MLAAIGVGRCRVCGVQERGDYVFGAPSCTPHTLPAFNNSVPFARITLVHAVVPTFGNMNLVGISLLLLFTFFTNDISSHIVVDFIMKSIIRLIQLPYLFS